MFRQGQLAVHGLAILSGRFEVGISNKRIIFSPQACRVENYSTIEKAENKNFGSSDPIYWMYVQGSANPQTPGSEKMRWKSCVLLPAAGRRTQLFILLFSEPGVCGFAEPCSAARTHALPPSLVTASWPEPLPYLALHYQCNLVLLDMFAVVHLLPGPHLHLFLFFSK